MQLIQVGKDGALSDPFSGDWRAVDPAVLPFHFTDLDKTLAGAFRALEKPAVAAAQPTDGVAAYAIHGDILTDVLAPLLPGVVKGGRAKIDLVVGREDRLPRQIRIIGPLLSDDVPTVVRVLTLSAFNQPVTVELPQIP